MKTIYLVRHAQYANPKGILVGRLPVELSETGLKQAQRLADYFSTKQISTIYSSPVVRCAQTSEIIARNKTPIHADVRLVETFSSYQGYWELDWSHFYRHQPDLGGETPQDLSSRMLSFWNSIVDNDQQEVIICSHGDPLYLLYVGLKQLPIPDIKQMYHIPKGDYQPKASVRKITIKDGGIEAEDIIEVDQLEKAH